MQLDMHYYATFAMARAAGLNSETSRVIATASQFVDDNVHTGHVKFNEVEASGYCSLGCIHVLLDNNRQVVGLEVLYLLSPATSGYL